MSSAKKMQPWLLDELVRSAVIDGQGVNDRPKPRRCPTCRQPTVAAWRDGNREAVHVDPVNLTRLGELQALTAGRRTFDHWGGEAGGLDLRRADTIAAWPAGNPHHPIRPEHRCNAPPLDTLPDPRTAPTPEHPPY